jgi:hypothetical protein
MTEYGPLVLLSPERFSTESTAPALLLNGVLPMVWGDGESATGPVVLQEFGDLLSLLESSPEPQRQVCLDPAFFILGDGPVEILKGWSLPPAGVRVLDFFGNTGSFTLLRNAWTKEALSSKGVLRVTLRAASGRDFDLREADLIYFLCRHLGEAKRIRCKRISGGNAPEEIQDLAILRMDTGCLVHFDCSSLPRHAGLEGWEYAARGVLYTCDETKDSDLRVKFRTNAVREDRPSPSTGTIEISSLLSGRQDDYNDLVDLRRAISAWEALEKSRKNGDAVWL